MTRKLRVAQLGRNPLWRVEELNRGFLGLGKWAWRWKKTWYSGWGGGNYEYEQFHSREEACQALRQLEREQEVEKDLNNDNWHGVTCG